MFEFLREVSPFSKDLVNPVIFPIGNQNRKEVEGVFKEEMEEWFKEHDVIPREFAFKSVSDKTTMFWIVQKDRELVSLKLTIFYKDEPYDSCAFFMYRKSGKRYDGLETSGEIKIKTMLYKKGEV